MSDLVARHVVIHGRVQGVWFRASVRDAAHARGVAGWAANRADGTVEAHLEGPAGAVAAVERFCAEGPPRAQVTHVEARDAEPLGAAGFEIRLPAGDERPLEADPKVAFAATVIGILVGTVAFGLTLYRTRVYTEDLAALERAVQAR